jgi:hypothetical protein
VDCAGESSSQLARDRPPRNSGDRDELRFRFSPRDRLDQFSQGLCSRRLDARTPGAIESGARPSMGLPSQRRVRGLVAGDSAHVCAHARVWRGPRLPRGDERPIRLSHAPFDGILDREVLKRPRAVRVGFEACDACAESPCQRTRRACVTDLVPRGALGGANELPRSAEALQLTRHPSKGGDRRGFEQSHRREVGGERRSSLHERGAEAQRSTASAIGLAAHHDRRPLACDGTPETETSMSSRRSGM